MHSIRRFPKMAHLGSEEQWSPRGQSLPAWPLPDAAEWWDFHGAVIPV